MPLLIASLMSLHHNLCEGAGNTIPGPEHAPQTRTVLALLNNKFNLTN